VCEEGREGGGEPHKGRGRRRYRKVRKEKRKRRGASSCCVLVVPGVLKPQTVTADPY
jgi:hypothetical protein